MAGIEPTPSKSNYWTPLSPCRLSQGGGICRQQKFTLKLTIELSFLRIKVEEVNTVIDVKVDLQLASTNTRRITRPEGFNNPVEVNKKNIDNIINKLSNLYSI